MATPRRGAEGGGSQAWIEADLAVTADATRVLRPPETFNTKNGGRRPVVILEQHPDVSLVEMEFSLRAFTKVIPLRSEGHKPFQTLLRESTKEPPQVSEVFKDDKFEPLTGRGAMPRDIDQVATACGFVRDTLATGGAGYLEPLWKWTMNIALFSKDPEATARRLSRGYVGYTPEETAAMLAEAQDAKTKKDVGFIKCSTIRKTGALQCAACPHRDLDKSPLNVPGAFGLPVPPLIGENNKLLPIPKGVYLNNDDTLQMMNERYRHVMLGADTVIFQNMGPDGWLLRKDDSIQADLSAHSVQCIGTKGAMTKKLWAYHMDYKLETAIAVFKPTEPHGPLPDYEFNLWRGYGIAPNPNYDWKLNCILEHIGKIICHRNKDKVGYFVRWLAWKVQNPAELPETAIGIKSDLEGTGKNIFINAYLGKFGAHGRLISNRNDLIGQHATNEYICLLVLDEALFYGDKQTVDLLKSLIVSLLRMVNPKFLSPREIKNMLGLIFLTNHG